MTSMVSEFHTVALMRHAQAVGYAPNDHARVLTEFGVEQARLAGLWLRQNAPTPDLVLVSSAARTQQTSQAVGFTCQTEISDDLYNAGSEGLIEAISLLPAEVNTVLLIAHNPGISDVAMMCGATHPFSTADCAVFTVNGSWSNWIDHAALSSHT